MPIILYELVSNYLVLFLVLSGEFEYTFALCWLYLGLWPFERLHSQNYGCPDVINPAEEVHLPPGLFAALHHLVQAKLYRLQ